MSKIPREHLYDHLARLLLTDNAILFVGSALRREAGDEDAAEETVGGLESLLAKALARRIEEDRPNPTLAAIAQRFETKLGRNALLAALREELDSVAAAESMLARLLASTVLPDSVVLTTRFDGIFEQALRETGKAFVPVVRDEDVPGIDASKLTLIKLLGDIHQPQTLVITDDDIDAFIDRLPAVSDVVKAFFATKTLILLGYDLQGEQFKRFFRRVSRNVAIFRRSAYAIYDGPLDETNLKYWEDQSVFVYPIPATEFLNGLGAALSAQVADMRTQPEQLDEAQFAGPLPPTPYKALESYARGDAAVFAGRDPEAEQLVNRILAHRLTVVYGESGTGKTSLLNAGVSPRLARRRTAMAIVATGPDLVSDLNRSLRAEADGDLPETGSLREAIVALNRDQDLAVALVVDQGEQLFTALDESERTATVKSLAELVQDASLDLHVALVIREDFFGRLHTLEPTLPGVLDVRFRLERLGREAAQLAIEEPARLYQVYWERALVNQLLDELYDPAAGGVAPPQLQIVCDRLFRAVTESGTARPGDARHITTELFDKLGGTAAILGEHLRSAVDALPEAQRDLARYLLGGLVTVAGVKQRVTLGDLVQLAAGAESTLAESVAEQIAGQVQATLDQLVRQRILRRIDGEERGVSYELVHDYLVPRIVEWLGEEFWATQRVRELLRQAVSEWRARKRLMAADDLRYVAEQKIALPLHEAERELLYASAAAYQVAENPWQSELSAEARRNVLLDLLKHPVATARAAAAKRLASYGDIEVVMALVSVIAAEPSAEVRRQAQLSVGAISAANPTLIESAVEIVTSVLSEPGAQPLLVGTLAVLLDSAPRAARDLPAALRLPILRAVLLARWRRHWDAILATTTQAAQGGFWGLGAGMGILIGWLDVLTAGQDRFSLAVLVQLAGLGLPLSGVVGAVSGGAAAFAGTVSAWVGAGVGLPFVQARVSPPWTRIAVQAVVGALLLAVGFVLHALVFAGNPQGARAALAGAIVGLAVVGAAGAQRLWPRWIGPAPVILAAVLAFVAIGRTGGATYRPGDALGSLPFGATVVAYEGASAARGTVSASLQGRSGGRGKELQLNEAGIAFTFPNELRRVAVCTDAAGEFEIAVNGSRLRAASVDQVDGATLDAAEGVVALSVPPNCNAGRTRLEADGPIRSLTIAGADVTLDSLCITPGVGACLEFEGIPAALAFDRAPLWALVYMGAVAGLGFWFGFRRPEEPVRPLRVEGGSM